MTKENSARDVAFVPRCSSAATPSFLLAEMIGPRHAGVAFAIAAAVAIAAVAAHRLFHSLAEPAIRRLFRDDRAR